MPSINKGFTKSRNQSTGQIRPLRSDTKVGTVEKKYNIDLNARSDKQIGTYLKEQGYPSLSKFLRSKK